MTAVEVWYPLLIDGGASPTFYDNEPFAAAPDWVNNKIYTYGPSFGALSDQKIWTHNATTGEALATTSVPTACGISSNTYIATPSLCVGADSNIYALTTDDTDRKARLRVSKFSSITMMEVGALVPAAIGLDSFGSSGVFDFILLPFQLNGVNYLILALTGWCGHLEIINADTMTSVGTLLYTNSCFIVNLVVGEQPNSHTQNIYCVASVGSGSNDVSITKIVFDASGPSVTDSIIGTVEGVNIDPTWTGNHIVPMSPMFGPIDNSVVFLAYNNSTNQARICKFVSGSIAWSVIVGTQGIQTFDMIYGITSSFSDLSAGTLVFRNLRSTTYYTIDLATGASVSATSDHFDGGFNAEPAAWFGSMPVPFEPGSSRLLYYSYGDSDLSPDWPTGGWAVWGFDPPPPPPPPGMIVVPCPPPIMDAGPIVIYEPGCECP